MFWSLWFMFFINITTGIALVSAASPMAQSMTNMTANTVAIMVGILALQRAFAGMQEQVNK